MPQIFTNQVITLDGQSLMAQATSANPIAWVNALSSTTVPSDTGDPTSYNGVTGTIDSAAVDGMNSRTARIVVAFGNSATSSAQAVKAIAVRAKLASQSDSEAVVFAYCTDTNSTITFPPSTSAPQVTRFAFNIIIQPGETTATVSAGDATLADLERFVSCHKAGDQYNGENQIIYGAKNFNSPVEFNSNVTHTEAMTLETVDGACLLFQEDGSKFGYLGYEINDGGLVITGRESGANNCESIIFGYIDDFDDGPNDPSYFMKMLTNFSGGGASAIQVYADCVVPYATPDHASTSTLGNANYKWASIWTNNLFTTTFKLNDTGSQYVNFDGEMFTFKLNPAANADPTMSISYVDGLYCSKPICNQLIRNNNTFQIRFYGGDSIEFWSDDGGETSGNIYFFRDDNGALGVQFYDTMLDEEICNFNYEGCRFTGPVTVRSGIKMPYPATEGELKLGCPCVLKATNGAQTAIKMRDVLARDSSGWRVIRGASTIAGVVLYTCDFSGGNEIFVSPLSYAATCRISVLSSAANGAPFLAMMID